MAKYKNKRDIRDDSWFEHNNEGNEEDSMREGNHIEGANENGNAHNQQNRNSEQVNRQDLDFTLKPYTSAVLETTKAIAVVQKQFEKLNELYIEHFQQIEKVPDVHRTLFKLRRECQKKDERIRSQKMTIDELKIESKEEKAILENTRKSLEDGKRRLVEEKAEQDNKILIAIEERKVLLEKKQAEMDTMFNFRLRKQEEEHKVRMAQLEDQMSKKEEERKDSMTRLQSDKNALSEQVSQKEKRIDELVEELARVKLDLQDMWAAKTTYLKQKEELQVTLDEVRNEFDLKSHRVDFYKEKFDDISRAIEEISIEYFDTLPSEEFEKIHKNLKAADPYFASVPISDEETSDDLRIAHVQRIVSRALYDHIWQPFSSERASSSVDFSNLLDEVFARLSGNRLSGRNGRAAIVWKVLTMRALHSAKEELPVSPTSTSHESSVSHFSNRASKAVHEILSKLSPLIDPARRVPIQEALLGLAQSAAEVWSIAQEDELMIRASLVLDPNDRDKWRCRFDPPSDDDSLFKVDIKTRPRLFTLFPRLMAESLPTTREDVHHIPGSFSTPQEGIVSAETIIHHGIGLPEASALVIRGKTEQEEIEALQKQIEDEAANAKKEVARRTRNTKSKRGSISGSLSGSVSGPLSPSALWGKGSSMMEMDNES